MVTSNSILSETILYIKNTLLNNITDPLGSNRPSGEKFVMTSYPRRVTSYPLITVRGNFTGTTKLGQCSERELVAIAVEVRIWARNEKEKNELFDDVFNYLKNNQLPSDTSGTSLNEQLFDFGLNLANDIEEEGDENIRSKVMEFRYRFITD